MRGSPDEILKHELILFGKHLQELRKAQKLSLRKLAQRCDIDSSDLAKYEKGEINVTFYSILQLEKGLGVDLKQLMDYNRG